MKVTNHGMKDRKLHQEGCPQKEVEEQPGYVEASAHVRIAEHNDIIASVAADSLLKLMLSRDKLKGAYKKVESNLGTGGVDRMSVEELLPDLREHRLDLLQQIRKGKYKPQPVRRVEIPTEEKGKFRKLGIAPDADRMIQKTLTQVLVTI